MFQYSEIYQIFVGIFLSNHTNIIPTKRYLINLREFQFHRSNTAISKEAMEERMKTLSDGVQDSL